MTTLHRTTAADPHFIQLVQLLDNDLAMRDGEDHSFYDQFNKIIYINHAVVLYCDEIPVGCGAIKPFDTQSAEVKRMYILPAHRGSGLAGQILAKLEQWAAEVGYTQCILETGKKQPEAIALYKKNGYEVTANYGQYHGVENSVCMCKRLVG